MSWRLPVADLTISDSDARAVARVLRQGGLGPGCHTRAFERGVAGWTGALHAAAVASGTAALHIACLLVGIGAGDEVIVPAMTFLATAATPRYTGADVVLADSTSPTDLNIDPDHVEALITPRTRAVMAVHMWGYPAQVAALRELCDARGLSLIEDTAQGIGARPVGTASQAGTVGHVGCLSFFSKKQLSTGEGGMVLTDDPELASRARSLSDHGRLQDDDSAAADVLEFGLDYAYDDPRAALGLSRLPRLSADIARRRATARGYRALLADVEGLSLMWSDDEVERSSHFAFGVLFDTPEIRDRARTALTDHGIQTTRYPVLHELTEYEPFAALGSLPNAEAAAERHLVLPISSHMTLDDAELVASVVRQSCRATSRFARIA